MGKSSRKEKVVSNCNCMAWEKPAEGSRKEKRNGWIIAAQKFLAPRRRQRRTLQEKSRIRKRQRRDINVWKYEE